MSLEMIDGGKGKIAGQRNGFAGHDTHQEPADQARAGSCGNAVKIGKANLRFVHRLANQRIEMVKMSPRSILRDDAAERRMQGGLREHQIGQDFAPVANDRRRRLVAACLDSQYQHGRSARMSVRTCSTKHFRRGLARGKDGPTMISKPISTQGPKSGPKSLAKSARITIGTRGS